MTTRNQRSTEAEAYRRWYRTSRWQKLREQVIVRDRFTCQRTGELLTGKHPAPNSPVANHKKAHKGDPVLFWDINNIETVAKRVHDSAVQSEERTGKAVVTIGSDGWPVEA